MKSVVVFDDSRTVRIFVEMSLQQIGYAVETFSDLGNFTPREGAPPDLVLLDVNMKEFFGTDLLAHIRQNWPGQPLIYLYSEMEEEKLRQMVDSSDADGYISKSWGFDGLVDTVRNVIGAPQ